MPCLLKLLPFVVSGFCLGMWLHVNILMCVTQPKLAGFLVSLLDPHLAT